MSKHKVKRYAGEDESMVEDDSGFSASQINAAAEEGAKDEKAMSSGPKTMSVAQPKAKVVTKEELAKSGLSLRDYMNKQQGLTRRKDASPMSAGPARPISKTPSTFPVSMKDRAESYGKKRAAARAADTADDAAKASTAAETARLRQRNMPASKVNASKMNPNTLLPKRMASGGSVSSRADGIAQRGKTRGTMC